MFHRVQVHASDSPRDLVALGLKLKRKHQEQFILQPCPAYEGVQCGIYRQRPERCQLFECRQLKGVAAGEISESTALQKIREVMQRVDRLNGLIHKAGKTDPKKPLSKCYEKVTAEPVDITCDKAVELRNQLALAMQELQEMIEKDFRP